MKSSTILTYLGAAGLAILGVTMAVTNPKQAEYEDYAVQRLTQYLKTDVCKKTQGFIESLVNFKCEKAVESVTPQMREIIASTTKQQDFMIFSIYRTDLKLNSWIPSYKFETVAAFNNFYTYRAEEQ
ncbi:DUF4359 domain-containing protein [Calothrix sp. PCC 7507]|uniref:DUF4359 domain-containing protein n=1 Tax=Calothrix sp. PCC 7507 TaxID=99598 RepID=UPI00029EC38D|nr:DUF4359 domain-containing protein [Calothrix sp. PCC 7507]AFY34071.1 hypothetical protein Cal7507_3679 [Calothrix sp. PCC 7507]